MMREIIADQHFKHLRQRPLGSLKGKARYELHHDFALSDEELVMPSENVNWEGANQQSLSLQRIKEWNGLHSG